MSHRLAGRSTSVGRQPGKPGWLATVVNLTGGMHSRRLVPVIHEFTDETSSVRVAVKSLIRT